MSLRFQPSGDPRVCWIHRRPGDRPHTRAAQDFDAQPAGPPKVSALSRSSSIRRMTSYAAVYRPRLDTGRCGGNSARPRLAVP